jgi:SpoVK/Ycf46/Vps4 family AAA+-type ATPase
MMCNALANWALEREYRAIYISSAMRNPGETDGANFWKIQHALWTAATSAKPTLIILEEFDAYLKAEEKALILNVLDGAEGIENPHGTLLIATTNYPEAIDERVLERPGRLDRIYIVPPIEDHEQAEAMLKLYLRQLWRDEHRELAHELVGYPGSFVREMLVFAVTELVESGKRDLPLSQLRASLVELKAQIASRDELVLSNTNGHQT